VQGWGVTSRFYRLRRSFLHWSAVWNWSFIKDCGNASRNSIRCLPRCALRERRGGYTGGTAPTRSCWTNQPAVTANPGVSNSIAVRAWASEGGASPLPGFWIFQRKKVVFWFWVGKNKFHHFGPPWKKCWENPLVANPEKILPTPMSESQMRNYNVTRGPHYDADATMAASEPY